MESLLELGVAAIKAGDLEKGKSILTEYLATNHDEVGWLWMSKCVSDKEEKRKCFQNALKINPENPYAQEGIRRLDASTPATSLPVKSPVTPKQKRIVKKYTILNKTNIPPKTNNAVTVIILLLILGQVWMFYRVDSLEKINTALASELSSVSSIAQNANRYAHCHDFSCY